MTTDDPGDVYDSFLSRVQRIGNIGEAVSLLSWDQQVMMPPGGTPARAKQLSALSAIKHQLLTDDELGELLDALEDDSLSRDQNAMVREVRREYDRATAVPPDIIEELAAVTSEALPIWKDARANDDFASFAPTLETLVGLRQEYASCIGPDRDPYAVLFDDYEPYLGIETADRVLGELRDELVGLIDAIKTSGVQPGVELEGPFDPAVQMDLVREALDVLGYDWDRGRLDTAPHPFSTGNMYDARVTTRFDDANPFDGLLSAVHEFGHAAYTLGLPESQYGTPLGDHRDLTVHESQSRLWENHVGRSREFWDVLLPKVNAKFPSLAGVPLSQVVGEVNRIHPENLIRVEADELTYHLHIVLRYEIERDLIQGDIDVRDVPTVWNEKMTDYLGVTPDTDTNGCLQDIHWSHASFGYFPTYSLGSILAAQLFHHAERGIDDLRSKMNAGTFGPLRDWLRENVHRHGCRYETEELIREATGEGFTVEYYLEYVRGKYGALYSL